MVRVRPINDITSVSVTSAEDINNVNTKDVQEFSSVGVIDVTYYYNLCRELASQAAASAQTAITKASEASVFANNASISATSASTSATNASASAELARQYAELYSKVAISVEEPAEIVDVWINPEGEATQVGSALSINGRSLSLLSDEEEVMSTITLPESGLVDDVKVNNVSVVTNKVANIDLTGYATTIALSQGLATKQNVIADLSDIRTKANSALQSINSTMVVNALGFTPYNATNPSGYITQSAINTHNVDTTAHDDIRDIAEEALSRAGQAVQSLVFDTTEDMEEYISDVSHKGELKVGDNLYIKDVTVDDYWVSAVLEIPDVTTGYYYEISPLSGEKPSIANMVTTDTSQTISGDKNFTGALKLNNYDVATQSFVTGQGYTTMSAVEAKGYITSSAIIGKEDTSNKVTSISSSSTNTQYPSAKCVYDIVGNIEATLRTIRGV